MEAMAVSTTRRTQTSWVTWAAWAGLAAPILFTLTFVVQELGRIDEYSPIEEPISALAAGPNGWIQSANFVVFGLLTIAFAAGLYRVLQPSKPGMIGSALLFISGIATILVGTAFPLREDAAGVTYDLGGHQPTGFVFFTSSALALLVISFALSKQTEWRKLAIPVRLAGILMLASIPFMGILVMPDDAPLHDWAGLAQRVIVLGLLFPARLALSYRMLRLPLEQARSASPIKRPARPSAETDAPRV